MSDPHPAGAAAAVGPAPLLVLRALAHAFRDAPVLAGLDLRLGAGERVALMGPNGSGKTTLLRIAAGLLAPSGGAARALPQVGRESERLRRTAVVLDRAPFPDALPGGECIRRLLALRGVRSGDAERAAAGGLAAFGLAGAAARSVAGYSHGMRRRLALAEAFAAAPDLLLLDEPTLGLDPLGVETLRGALAAAADRGAGALVASNDPRFVTAACDRVVFLHRGRIVADASPEELVARLGGESVIEVEGPSPGPGFRDPPGVRRLGGEGEGMRFAAAAGAGALPGLCAGLLAAGAPPRALRIREPDLSDAFLALAGAPLSAADAAGEGGRG